MKIKCFNKQKHELWIHAFKDTVPNRICHSINGGSLEITITVPLNRFWKVQYHKQNVKISLNSFKTDVLEIFNAAHAAVATNHKITIF